MLKIGIIGFGNAGNQIAELAFKERNISSIAINSSEKDLSTLSVVTRITIGIQGSGKDRNIAKTYMKKNFKRLNETEDFAKVIDDNEIIFVISSTGGGSGSGVAPMMYDILSQVHSDKKFILVGILPELRESIGTQQNTIDYLKELQNIEDVTYILYDNNRKNTLSSFELLKTVNAEVVEDICIIRGDYQYTTPFNSIDERDTLKILNTSGMINISKVYEIREKDMDNITLEDILVNYIKNQSCMCEIERDGIIKRMGLILNLNEKLQKYIDKRLLKIKDIIGEPVEGFEHDYVCSVPNQDNKLILLLAGLSMPDDRIEKILQRMDEAKDALLKKKEGSILDDVEHSYIKDLRKEEFRQNIDEVNVGTIFDKFM
jgi:tubulin-like protein CetZ